MIGSIRYSLCVTGIMLPLSLAAFVTVMHAQILDFGDVQLGKSKDSSAVLTNPFPTPFVVTSSTIKNNPSDFAITAGAAPFTIPPGGSHQVAMRFTPTALGVRRDTLILEGLFPGSPLNIPLKGNGIPLPVEYLFITALESGGDVILRWATASESNNHGFEIQRSRVPGKFDGREYETLAFVKGAGNSSTKREYQYHDEGASSAIHLASLRYRIRQVDFDGSSSYSPVISILSPVSERRWSIRTSVYPNPTRDGAVLSIETLPGDGIRSIHIFDHLGIETGAIVINENGVGSSSVSNRMLDGRYFPRAGIYMIRITAESGTTDLPLVRLR